MTDPLSRNEAHTAGSEAAHPIPGALTRGNLQQFTAAERRKHAHQRGRSTPSPEPDFHAYESERSWVTPPGIPPDALAYGRLIPATFPGGMAPDMSSESEFGGPAPVPGPARKLPSRDSGFANLLDNDDEEVKALPSERSGDGGGDGGKGDHFDETSSGVFEQWPTGNQPSASLMEHHLAKDKDSPSADAWAPSFHHDQYPLIVDDDDGGAGPEVSRERAYPDVLWYRPEIPRQQPPAESQSKPEPRFPPNFPAYHCTQNMNEIAAYLANASYVAALGGPPLANLKYGIIIVPAGEESLLFSQPPDFPMNQEFLDAVDDANRDYDRALRMHDPDKDSEEFVRSRFDEVFPSVSAEEHQNVEAALPGEDKGKKKSEKDETDRA